MKVAVILTVVLAMASASAYRYKWAVYKKSYLSAYTQEPKQFKKLLEAERVCLEKYDCAGVVKEGKKRYTLRRGLILRASPSKEIVYMNPYPRMKTPGYIRYYNMYAGGYVSVPGLKFVYESLLEAQDACLNENSCEAVTSEPLNSNRFTLRRMSHGKLMSSPSDETTWKCNYKYHPGKYLGGYAKNGSAYAYQTLREALAACDKLSNCGGVTWEKVNNRYTTRAGRTPLLSPTGENSWKKN